MNKEQEINNLRCQAAEAFRTGNFSLMNQLDEQAQMKKHEFSKDIFMKMKRQVDRLMPKAVSTAVINQPIGRVWRISQ